MFGEIHFFYLQHNVESKKRQFLIIQQIFFLIFVYKYIELVSTSFVH